MNPPTVVAEIGCNHKGDVDIAKEMITVAASFCKADYVKFQKRNNRELLTPEQYAAPHPVPENSYGATYGEHREFLEFDMEQHAELQRHCAAQGIGYAISVWDTSSAKDVVEHLNPPYVKIPSGTNQHFELLGYLCDHFEGDVHASLGMTTQAEEEKLVSFFEGKQRSKSLILYACTSGYPVPFEDICLYEITRLIERFGDRVKQIGFSGHHLGIAADIGALTLGAEWIERHYTLDRTWKGTDHAASLEPMGMRKLVRDCRAVAKALAYKPSELLEIEKPQRKKLKWGQYNQS